MTAKKKVTKAPDGYVKCKVIKAYEDKNINKILVLVERRFKSLASRGFVKEVK